jgi:hypothetical protein
VTLRDPEGGLFRLGVLVNRKRSRIRKVKDLRLCELNEMAELALQVALEEQIWRLLGFLLLSPEIVLVKVKFKSI